MKNHLRILILLISCNFCMSQGILVKESETENRFLIIEYADNGKKHFSTQISGSSSGVSFKLGTTKNKKSKNNQIKSKYFCEKKPLSEILNELNYSEYAGKLKKNPLMDIDYYQQGFSKEKANKQILKFFIDNDYFKER